MGTDLGDRGAPYARQEGHPKTGAGGHVRQGQGYEGSTAIPLEEIRQVVATGVTYLERYGVKGSAKLTHDTPTHDAVNREPE